MEATPCEIMQSRSISPKRSPPSRARLDLVVHHVLEALVVGGAEEDGRLEPPAGV